MKHKIGLKIKAIRQEAKITQEVLAERCNISVEAVFNNISKKSFKTRDEQEVAGYADLLATIFDNYQNIPLSENYIRQLHKILLSYSDKDERHHFSIVPNNFFSLLTS